MEAVRNLEDKRIEVLSELITEIYGDALEDEADAWSAKGYPLVTDLYIVGGLSSEFIMLTPFHEEVHAPIITRLRVPPQIRRWIHVEDVFLLTAANLGDEWAVVYMSPPYEAVTWSDGGDDDDSDQHEDQRH